MSGTNSFTIGSDTILSIISNGSVLAATILVSFDAKQITADLDSVGMDGANRYRYVERGWDIALEFDRTDATLDDFFAAKEAAQYSGGSPPILSLTETTTNTNGSIVKYRYDGLTLKYDTIGARKGDAKVEPKVSGKASRRVKVQ